MKLKIPVAEPVLGKEEIKLVTRTLKSGWISSRGENITKFEKEFAKFCGAKYGISTSNGTAALHLCLAAAEIGKGDEVIVPTMTFVATANAVSYTGATPVFIDSEKDTWNIDPEKIKEKINRNTKAIIPVHLYGHPANMGQILKVGKSYSLLIFEDAAEAHGALYKSKTVGSLGHASCFSFFGNKIITTGEGGMVTTSNRILADRVKTLRDHGASRVRKYHYPWLGFNYRMTNIQAALGLAQLKKIKRFIKKKRKIAGIYEKYLEDLVPEITLQPEAKWATNVYWMYSILVNSKGKKNRDYLMKELKKKGIETRPFFYPLHRLKRYRIKGHFPVADYLARTGVSLPSSPNLTEEQIKYVCDNIVDILK